MAGSGDKAAGLPLNIPTAARVASWFAARPVVGRAPTSREQPAPINEGPFAERGVG